MIAGLIYVGTSIAGDLGNLHVTNWAPFFLLGVALLTASDLVPGSISPAWSSGLRSKCYRRCRGIPPDSACTVTHSWDVAF